MNNSLVIGIDIGGSHITAACIDLNSRAITSGSIFRNSVNSKGSVTQIIEDWSKAIIACKDNNPNISNKIGIAMPGPFDYNKGVSFIKDLDKYEALYNLNVKELLADKLSVDAEDIVMMNDASCFLKGEVFNGTAGNSKNILGLTLGTGLGSAICIDGVVYDGDMYCHPYKDATAEDYLSTRWFVKRYEELTGQKANNVKEIREKISSESSVISLFKEFGVNLGVVLASYIKKYNIEAIIIGGNLINAWELFIHETKEVLNNNSINVDLLQSKLGEEAALIGGGSLFTAQQ